MQSFRPLLLIFLFLALRAKATAQVQTQIDTAKGRSVVQATPHPLSWWTKNPLRLDSDGELMIGYMGQDGKRISAQDYSVRVQAKSIGTLSRHRVMQVITSIYSSKAVAAVGWTGVGDPEIQWKSLLVQSGASDQFVELYRLQCSFGVCILPLRSAVIYGVGPNAILVTNDRSSGNGGTCSDGYWWLDRAGAHPIDFTPLLQAVNRAIPANSTYVSNCWALHPEESELRSWVQKADAQCHGCGGLGEVRASYRIENGQAMPVKVTFTPDHEE